MQVFSRGPTCAETQWCCRTGNGAGGAAAAAPATLSHHPPTIGVLPCTPPSPALPHSHYDTPTTLHHRHHHHHTLGTLSLSPKLHPSNSTFLIFFSLSPPPPSRHHHHHHPPAVTPQPITQPPGLR